LFRRRTGTSPKRARTSTHVRAHDPASMFDWIPECLVRDQYRGTCQQGSPNDCRYRQSLTPFQADVTFRCRIRPGRRPARHEALQFCNQPVALLITATIPPIDKLHDVDAWSAMQQLRQWRCDSKRWREWRGSESWASWQSVYKTMTTLEIRFIKCVFRHSHASLDFVCRLFYFELVFSVQ
jgi:hypothetical protein